MARIVPRQKPVTINCNEAGTPQLAVSRPTSTCAPLKRNGASHLSLNLDSSMLLAPRYHQARTRVRITISKENYLKAIAEAQAEGEVVKAVTLTRWLHVSAPAVTMAIRRLKRDSLIRVDDDGRIALTPGGCEIANRLLNRHHLIERMLTEIFGLEWFKVHD